ncbi:MAG TPA: zinc-binding dehydrogenase [Candidatus Baltobacteraceae bacterium]|nr:zinc-binding dehydrogenase [Candidatus Baltobacteraceae bacterium]
MIALQYARFGEPAEVVVPTDVPVPAPREGEEVLLRMVRSPIHNHDLATIRGIYGVRPKLPAIGGTEFLGRIGDKRYAGTAKGAWAEDIVANSAALVPVPEGIDDDRACQLLAMPLSTLVLFDDLRTRPGMWIAQTAANGAVGKMLMLLAQRHGVNIVNFVRRPEAAEELKKYGARFIVVTDHEGWEKEAHELTGGAGFARIVDSVAGPQTVGLQKLLAQFGELIVFGALSGSSMKLAPGLMIAQESVVRGFWLNAWIQRNAEKREGLVRRVFELALAGELPLPVAGVYPLRDASAALKAAEAAGRGGKVLFAV